MASNTLGYFSDSEGDDLIRNIDENEVLMASNTLGYFSDSEGDDLIRNIDENEVLTGVTQTGRGEKRKNQSGPRVRKRGRTKRRRTRTILLSTGKQEKIPFEKIRG